MQGQPGVFRDEFVADKTSGTLNTATSTFTGTGLTSGKQYKTRVTAYFGWVGPGMAPGGQAGMNISKQAYGQDVFAP